MNKNVLMAVALVVVLAVIGGAMVMMSPNGVAESEKGEGASTTAAGEMPEIKMGNPVVAKVNGAEIMRADVLNFIGALPAQMRQQPIQTLFPMALDQVVSNRVISAKASGAGLEEDTEVAQMVEQAKGQIIRNVYVERQVSERVTQKKLLDSYEKLLDSLPEVEETRASHILVKTKEEAEALVKKLDEGADFAELAKENSTGPSANNGGDLGYFAKDQMVPEFANAAFALDKGSYTKEPVETQFGFHVIKATDRRMRPEPEFEVIKPQLENQLRQEILTNLVKEWEKDTKIEKFDINGDPVKK